MNESLTCTSCSKIWKRERTRGRKPLLCPKCVKEQAKDIAAPQKAQKSNRSIKAKPIAPAPKAEPAPQTELTINKVISSLSYAGNKSVELAESTKKGSAWKCPSCNHTIELFVAINAIPTHRCTPNMVSVKLMERIK